MNGLFLLIDQYYLNNIYILNLIFFNFYLIKIITMIKGVF